LFSIVSLRRRRRRRRRRAREFVCDAEERTLLQKKGIATETKEKKRGEKEAEGRRLRERFHRSQCE